MTTSSEIAHLRNEVQAEIKRHSPRADSFYHNGGTVLALAATSAATIIPTDFSIWAKLAAAFATFLVATARALDFGGRWRFHIDMRANYSALLDRIDEIELLQPTERPAALARIFDKLESLRLREGSIPGAGAPTGAGNAS